MSSPIAGIAGIAGIARPLLDWYTREKRDLPWRRTRDPYRIWISEAMLQQTRVETVIPYYERFIERFPDVHALAVADEEDVLRVWSGLGYYARARNLKSAAEQMVKRHGGEVPSEEDALRALPGVGPYTAGALRSIAFGRKAAIVDGNVTRVLSRLLARPRLEAKELWRVAERIVPADAPGDFNQALMELGATVCTPAAPRCDACPLCEACEGHRSGAPESFPAPKVRPVPREVFGVCALVRRRRARGSILMTRRPSRGLLGGLWELPSLELNSVEVAAEDELEAMLREQAGLETRTERELGRVQHGFTHRALVLRVVELSVTGGRLRAGSSARWCDAEARADLATSTLVRKVLALAGL